MLLYAPVSTVRFSLRRSISSGTARGRWAQPPFPRSSLRASASAQAPRSWLSSSREELPPHSHLKVPDFGGKGTVLKWLKAVGDPVQEGELMVDMGFSAFDVELVSEHNGFLAEVKVPAGAAVDPETPLAVIVSDLDFVPFFTKDVAPPLPETSATEPGPSISRTNSDQEPAAADMASSSSSSSSQGAASKADESSPEMPEHKQEEPKQKEAEAPSARSSASGGARGEDGEKNKASTTESEELNFKSTTSTSSPSSSEVEVARSHAQALAAAQSAAQAEAQLAIAKAKALEVAVEAAEAAATAAEEAAGVSNSSSNAGEEEGISSLTLLKMVKTIVASPEVAEGAEEGTPRSLTDAEVRELKDMALRESQTLQHCFVAASDTDNGKPASGESLPAGFNASDFFAFVLPHVRHALAAKSAEKVESEGPDSADLTK